MERGAESSAGTDIDIRALLNRHVKRGSQSRLLAVRVVGFSILAGTVYSGDFWFVLLSLPVLFFIWLTGMAMDILFRRNCSQLPELAAASNDGEDICLPRVTIIAPGRNEEAGIEACVRSLASLDYPGAEVIAVNDHSTDATGDILRRLEPELPNVRIIHDPPVQDGWLGKANAIWQALQAADSRSEWILLTDADVVFHPKVLRRAMAVALRDQLDYLTCVPVLECDTLAEQLILPVNWRSILVSANPRNVSDPKKPAIGIGAFALVKRSVYLACGGHAAIAGHQPEDTLLAALIKQRGGKVGVAWTAELLRVRLYRGLVNTVEASARKNRVNADDSVGYLLGRTSFWICEYILPLPLAAWSIWKQVAIPGMQWTLAMFSVMALGAYLAGVRDIRSVRRICPIPAFIPWLHPITGVLKVMIDTIAIVQSLLHRPMAWRGRDFVNVRTESRSERS